MPAAKKNPKTPAPKKSATTRRRNNITVLKNTIRLLQSDLADALNREKAAKDRARAVTKELEQVRANAVGMADWLQRVTTEHQVLNEQREALAEKYVNTTLDAHEIAKYAVAAHDQALLAESALTAAGAYIDRLLGDLGEIDRVLGATVEAFAKVLKVSPDVVYTMIGFDQASGRNSARVSKGTSYFERKDRFVKGKAKMADIGQKVRDYATMPVDKVKMRLDAELPVAATYEWKGGTAFYGENPPPATIVAMASMQEGTSP